jgi:2-polyprenyl-3-methyl-5-hydroxy-6-metoxy-1,4-benzoquinol methylase
MCSNQQEWKPQEVRGHSRARHSLFDQIMKTLPPVTDRSRELDERSWWDLWNTSYRAEENRDQTSTELFAHVVGLMREVTQGPGCRILEVACGTGTLSRQLSFSSYHGLDISAAAIVIARQKAELIAWPAGTSRPSYEAADFHDWPLPAESLDVVLCVDAISCFRDQAFTLRKIAESLQAGGKIVLTTVNPFVYNRIRRVGGVRLENGPVSHWLTRSELHGLMKRAGLVLERSYTIMPRGNKGILRLINARRLNQIVGRAGAVVLRRLKEQVGLGQYRVVVARKEAAEG